MFNQTPTKRSRNQKPKTPHHNAKAQKTTKNNQKYLKVTKFHPHTTKTAPTNHNKKN